jgi:hypothetical protein
VRRTRSKRRLRAQLRPGGAHPAVAAERIRLVIDISDGGEGPAAADVSFLDLVVVAFDVGSEAVEVVA